MFATAADNTTSSYTTSTGPDRPVPNAAILTAAHEDVHAAQGNLARFRATRASRSACARVTSVCIGPTVRESDTAEVGAWSLSVLQFIDGLVRSAAWPLAVVLISVILRSKIAAMFNVGPLRKLKVGPAEAEWDTAAKQTELLAADVAKDQDAANQTLPLRLLDTARTAPAGAIAEAALEMEVALRRLLSMSGLPESALRHSLRRLASLARQRELIDMATHSSIDGLAALRNLAIHGERRISFTQAVEFLVIADAVMYALTEATQHVPAQEVDQR